MSEKRFIALVLGRLPRTIHRQSMTFASLSTNGTPDRYLDGPKGDCWIEFKYLQHMPANGIVVGALTELQMHWLERRHRNGNNAYVFVGLPNKYVAVQKSPLEWRKGTRVEDTVTLDEAAAWIRAKCGE